MTILSALLVLLMILTLALLVFYQLWKNQANQKSQSQLRLKELELMDKMVTLLSVKSPLDYQAVQSMHSVSNDTELYVDPSDEAEAERYFVDHPEEVNSFESSTFESLVSPDYGPIRFG